MLTDEVLAEWCGGIMREAVGNYGKNLAVSRRIHAC